MAKRNRSTAPAQPAEVIEPAPAAPAEAPQEDLAGIPDAETAEAQAAGEPARDQVDPPDAPEGEAASEPGPAPAENLPQLELMVMVPQPLPPDGLVTRRPCPKLNSRQGQVQNGLYRQLTAAGVKLRGQQDVYPYLLDLIGDAAGMQGDTPLHALVAPFAGTIE